MKPFLKKFFPEVYTTMKEDTRISNYCKFDSQLLTSFTSSLYVAGLVASFFASSITRYFGRKPSILAGGAAFLSGSALNGAATNLYMLIFGRVLLGVGVGFANQVVYLESFSAPRLPFDHLTVVSPNFHVVRNGYSISLKWHVVVLLFFCRRFPCISLKWHLQDIEGQSTMASNSASLLGCSRLTSSTLALRRLKVVGVGESP